MEKNETRASCGHACPHGKIKGWGRISALFPEHKIYVEPFAGDISVILSKSRSKVETLNDEHGYLAGFFRHLRLHRDALLAEIDSALSSRQESELTRGNAEADTELGRAIAFFFRRIFVPGEDAARRGDAILSRAFTVRARLSRVCIEAKPPLDVIRFFDSPDTLFFVNLPTDWCVPARLAELRGVLSGCSGRWIVLGGVPEYLEAFSGFRALASADSFIVFSKNFSTKNETRFSLPGRQVEAA